MHQLLTEHESKKEYTVTVGTNFQFYIPVVGEAKKDYYYYNVNPFDFAPQHAENSLRPAYKKTSNNYVMFQPEYLNPYVVPSEDKNEKDEKHVEKDSDASRPGIYTFAAAVNHNSRYDAMRVKLNIVEGEPFEITSVTSGRSLIYGRWVGKDLTILWKPCKELYGENSKVRILLSDDFGQTYKYVLADEVPNTGSATVMFPYIKTGKISNYLDWNFTQNGGRIKIEVKGEAAFDVYPKRPYSFQGGGTPIPLGWEIDPAQQHVQFKLKNESEGTLPPVYVEVANREEANSIPKPALVAYNKTTPNNTVRCTYTETTEGVLIRRSWQANVNGTPYTYTQLLKLPDVFTDVERVRNETQKLTAMAKDLYKNRGNIGYPKPWLSASKDFETAYAAVFNTSTHEVKTTATENDVQRLNEVLTALSNIGDNDVVKPEHGKYYKVRSYVQPYGRKAYFYIVDNEQGVHFIGNETEATLWKCEIKNGKYIFTGLKEILFLET